MVTVPDIARLQEMVTLIESETQRVKRYVDALSPEDLERSSPCEMWTVGDVVGHLVWFAETYGGMMERGLGGDLSPTPGFPTTPGTLAGPEVDQMYGQGAITRRKELRENLLPAFHQTYHWLNEMLQGIRPEDWQKPCYHTLRTRPMSSFLPIIIQELAVHQWDILSTLEAAPSLSLESVPALLEKLPGNRRPWTMPFSTGPSSAGPLRFRFQLSGPAGGWRDIVVAGGQARLEAAGDGGVDLRLRGDTGAFLLLMYSRLTLDAAIADGRVTAEGKLDLVPAFDRWLAGH